MTLHTPLHKRAEALLKAHFKELHEDDKDYLQSILSRKIVWGTNFQNGFVERVEDKFKCESPPSA